jgi:peptidoglycan/LPS O-acetylase OafA/YrhL
MGRTTARQRGPADPGTVRSDGIRLILISRSEQEIGSMGRRMYHTLDGLRGLAAAAVVLTHMPATFPTAWFPVGGYLAVDLFFALSGFVLAEAYSARLDAGLPFGAFMWRRILRLWPLYALGLVLGAAPVVAKVAVHHAPPSALAPALAAIVYCPWNGPEGELYPLNFPAWSLFYELVGNVVMAAAWRRLTNQILVLLVCGSAIALVILALKVHSLDAGFYWSGAPVALARLGFSFFLGILLWRARPRLLALSAWIPMILLALVLAAGTTLLPRNLIDLFFIFLVIPPIVWIGASTQPTGASLFLFEGIGAASYALYAVHVPVLGLIGAVASAILHLQTRTLPVWTCFVVLSGLVLLGWALNRLDVAARSRLDRFARRLIQRPAKLETPI